MLGPGRRSLARAVSQLLVAEAEGTASTRSFSTLYRAAVSSSTVSTVGSIGRIRCSSIADGSSPLGAAVRALGNRSFGTSIVYPPPEAHVGLPAPQFSTQAVSDGEFVNVKLDDYKGKYVILFFYPKDFTFVCPTEIIAFSDRAKEFAALNCQLLACSTDTEEVHLAWIKTKRQKGGLGHMQIPILADTTKEIASKYGVLVKDLGIALRGLFIINPEGVVEQITINNLPIGRSVDEAKRLLQAIQFVKEHGEVCPADWKPGGKTMIADPEKSQAYFSGIDEGLAASGSGGASEVVALKTKRHYETLLAGGKPLLVDFMAPWCGKCRMIDPFVEELKGKYPGLEVAKFDTTEEALEGFSAELGVDVLPTFRFFKGGKQVLPEVTGYKKRPLEDAVQKLLEL